MCFVRLTRYGDNVHDSLPVFLAPDGDVDFCDTLLCLDTVLLSVTYSAVFLSSLVITE